MSVLVYIDTLIGKITKSGMEAVQYGSKIGETTVITNGAIDANQLAKLGGYGASKVLVNRNLGSLQVIINYFKIFWYQTGTKPILVLCLEQDIIFFFW
jgi:hypothetical protein